MENKSDSKMKRHEPNTIKLRRTNRPKPTVGIVKPFSTNPPASSEGKHKIPMSKSNQSSSSSLTFKITDPTCDNIKPAVTDGNKKLGIKILDLFFYLIINGIRIIGFSFANGWPVFLKLLSKLMKYLKFLKLKIDRNYGAGTSLRISSIVSIIISCFWWFGTTLTCLCFGTLLTSYFFRGEIYQLIRIPIPTSTNVKDASNNLPNSSQPEVITQQRASSNRVAYHDQLEKTLLKVRGGPRKAPPVKKDQIMKSLRESSNHKISQAPRSRVTGVKNSETTFQEEEKESMVISRSRTVPQRVTKTKMIPKQDDIVPLSKLENTNQPDQSTFSEVKESPPPPPPTPNTPDIISIEQEQRFEQNSDHRFANSISINSASGKAALLTAIQNFDKANLQKVVAQVVRWGNFITLDVLSLQSTLKSKKNFLEI